MTKGNVVKKIHLLWFAVAFLTGCAKYDYDFKRAVEYKNISNEDQVVVAVVGPTNGPFRCLGAGGMLSRGQPGKLGYVGNKGAGVSWTAPAGHTNAYQSYFFEDQSGKRMMVVKTLPR
jgi:hypothetical protein